MGGEINRGEKKEKGKTKNNIRRNVEENFEKNYHCQLINLSSNRQNTTGYVRRKEPWKRSFLSNIVQANIKIIFAHFLFESRTITIVFHIYIYINILTSSKISDFKSVIRGRSVEWIQNKIIAETIIEELNAGLASYFFIDYHNQHTKWCFNIFRAFFFFFLHMAWSLHRFNVCMNNE